MSKFESCSVVLKKKSLLVFSFVASWVVLSLAVYMLLCFSDGRVGVFPQFQKTLMIDSNKIYNGKLSGFEIKDDSLVANDKRVSLSFNTGVKKDKFKYATIFVNSVNKNENVSVRYKVRKGKFLKENVNNITLKQGANRLKFNSNDAWSDIRIDFKKKSAIVISIDSIVLSRHALAPQNAIYIFLALFIVFGVCLYFFFYKKLRNHLQEKNL
ncbi:MAG: hypothetical protein LBN20_03445 [Endomicrobium sp.]|jgi:hypothetical protein|nr:hypothetical protein [Endomicrobium sp.]